MRIAAGRSTSPSSTAARTSSASSRGPSTACASGSRSWSARGASSSGTPRTSSARRFLAPRLPRAPHRRGARRGDSARVPRDDARAGGPPSAARRRPARPHAARRGPDSHRAAARSTSPSSPTTLRDEFRAVARRPARARPGRGPARARRRGARRADRPRAAGERAPPYAGGHPRVRRSSGATLAVEDDGPGIRGRYARQVFERFYRGEGGHGFGQRARARDRARAGEAMGGGSSCTRCRADGFTLRLPAAIEACEVFPRENVTVG